MNSRYNNLKPNIAIEALPLFSASFAASGIAPFSALVFTNLPQGTFDLTVSATCTSSMAGEECVVFSFAEKTYQRLDTSLFSEKKQGVLRLTFHASDFAVNRAYLDAVDAPQNAMLTVSARIADVSVEASAQMRITPADEWQGAFMYPETLASFVCPQTKAVATLTEGFSPLSSYAEAGEVQSALQRVAERIRDAGMVCAAKDSYSPERRQTIKNHDALCAKYAAVATPVELAVLFCAFAERLAMKPMIVMTTSLSGSVSLYCGVRLSDAPVRGAVCESFSKIRGALENGELMLVEPTAFSGAQNIDIGRACMLAADRLRRTGTQVLAAIDIASARADGIMPLFAGTDALPEIRSETPKDALRMVYEGLTGTRVFKMLGGEYGGYDVLPLVSPKPDLMLQSGVEQIVRPLEITEKPTVFAGLSDHVLSFALKDQKAYAYNKAELEKVQSAYQAFCARLAEKDHLVAGLYEKAFHERASRMAFGTDSGASNYLICGFMRLCERESGTANYLPLCFVRVNFTRLDDYTFEPLPGAPLINTVLLSLLSEKHLNLAAADTPDKVISLFETLIGGAFERLHDTFSEITLIRECALIRADLSEPTLWDDIRRNAKKMLENPNLAPLLTGAPTETAADAASDGHPRRIFPLAVPYTVRQALDCGGNVVFSGGSAHEKTDVIVNRVAAGLADGEKTLIASENPEFLQECARRLEAAGFGEAVLRLDRVTDAESLLGAIRERAAAAAPIERNAASPDDSKEISEIVARLQNYQKQLGEPDGTLGVSLIDLLTSYCSAKDTLPAGSELAVNDAAFEHMNGAALDGLFETAEKLVAAARAALLAVDVPETTPLCEHPLHAVKTDTSLDEAGLHEVYELIARILPVFSEYRETFAEFSDSLGLAFSDIKTLDGLLTLNELYRLLVCARELDLSAELSLEPEALVGLSKNTDALQKAHARMENIEYRLRFFSPEIFEDVDSLLAGYDGNTGASGNFIKKFLIKKNSRDVLAQYVPAEKRGVFASQNVSELYKLLAEYRSARNVVNGVSDASADENTVKLADFVKKAGELLGQMCPQLAEHDEELAAHTGALLRFVGRLTEDAHLSKKITYARAAFAQVYSENECLLARLSTLLGADFSELCFENGALNYDGFSDTLRRLEANLAALPAWLSFLEAKRAADAVFPSFSAYLLQYGIRRNTDRVFAASLLAPAAKGLIRKYGLDKDAPMLNRTKKRYRDLLAKQTGFAASRSLEAYRQRLKHTLETANLAALEAACADGGMTLCEWIAGNKSLLFSVFPCVLIHAADAGRFFGGERIADTLVTDDNGKAGLLLSTAACASRVDVFLYGAQPSDLTKNLLAAGAVRCDISYRAHPSGNAPDALLSTGGFLPKRQIPAASITLAQVNGTLRRATDLANPAEAEASLAKALEMLGNGAERVAIFAFTPGQCAYIRHLLCLNAENNDIVREIYANGRICVRDAFRPAFEAYSHVVVSFGAASDPDGNVCRSFGFGSEAEFCRALGNIASAACGETVFVTSFAEKELDQLRARTREAGLLHGVVQFVSSGTTALAACTEPGLPEPLLRSLFAAYPDALPALGRYAFGADAVCCEPAKDDSASDELTAILYDSADGTDLFERLALPAVFEAGGIRCKMLSLLDVVNI